MLLPLRLLAGRLAAFALVIVMLASPVVAQSFTFSGVRIEGNQRIEPATILSLAGIEGGQSVSAGEVNTALQNLQGSGLFERVEVEPQGSTLVIRVAEFPTINQISIEGNRRLDDTVLSALLTSAPRRVFSPTVAESDAAAIVGAYEAAGRFSASVDPKIIRRSDNRVDLIFEVTEGRVIEIERISFVGNRTYSDRRLRRVLGSKQANVFRQLIQRDTFVADRIEFDRQVLRDFYLSRGFVDFQILGVSSEFARERNATFITFNLREGQRFRFGQITTSSELEGIDPATFLEANRIKPGRFFTPTAVDETIARMERRATQQGLDFIRVEPQVTRNDRDLTLDIDFQITRGPRVFVERIDIEGNQTTLDRVIRRQFRTVEGDPFNPREIRAASERIRALRFFAEVDVQSREGSSDDQVIVDVDVEEQPTGTLGFGASYTVSEGIGFLLTFSERNFLGRGQTLRFDLNTTGSTGALSFSFIEPAFLGRDLAFGISVFQNETSSSSSNFDTDATGGEISFTFPVGEQSRLRTSYRLSFDEVSNVDADSSPILLAEEGDRVTSSIGYTYTYDSRTSGLNPNAGVLLSFGQELAGIGGDNEYIRTTARAVAQTLAFNEEVTLRATVEGGALTMLTGNSTVIDRFFLRSSQLRGFEFRGVGPRDLDAGNEDALGGNLFVSARFESEFPLGLPEELGITGGLFLDMGSVWGLDNRDGAGGADSVDDSFSLRSAIGVAINWSTPIGPLTFSFAQPIVSEDFDREQVFDISITTRF
ncbi:MAG: outer membrane protein assembly factor BamA [Pseudomonadota bacterium]